MSETASTPVSQILGRRHADLTDVQRQYIDQPVGQGKTTCRHSTSCWAVWLALAGRLIMHTHTFKDTHVLPDARTHPRTHPRTNTYPPTQPHLSLKIIPVTAGQSRPLSLSWLSCALDNLNYPNQPLCSQCLSRCSCRVVDYVASHGPCLAPPTHMSVSGTML